MRSFISRLLLKMGFGNKLFRRLAGTLAVALIPIAPELDVQQTTEVFMQIVSGIVVYISGLAELQLDGSQK